MDIISKKSRIRNWYTGIVESSFYMYLFRILFTLLLIIHCIENTSVIYSDAVWLNVMYLFRNLLYIVLLTGCGFFTVYRKEELILAGVFVAAGGVSFLTTTDFGLMEFFIILLASRNESSRWLISWFAVIKTAAVLITLLFWRIGVLDSIYYQDDAVGYYNTYGFCHRNVFAANIVIICLAWLYLRWRSMVIWDVIVWLLIAAGTYFLTVSRTGFIILVLTVIVMYAVAKRQSQFFKIPRLKQIVIGIFAAILLVSIIGTVFYSEDSAVWKLIDSIFTKRFQFSNYCLKEYGISLFGQNLPFVSTFEAQSGASGRLILDNSFIRALLYYGLIPGALFIGCYLQALLLSLKRRGGKLIASLIILAVYGASERYMLDVFYCFPLVTAWAKYYFQIRAEGTYGARSDNFPERKTVFGHAADLYYYCKRKIQ